MRLLLAPHHDDETLFAAYTCLRVRPHVVVCTEAASDGHRRRQETAEAMKILGCPWTQMLGVSDERFNERLLRRHILKLADPRNWAEPDEITTVYAPAVEPDGHEQHNAVGQAALDIFGADRVVCYLTYRRGHLRTRSPFEVTYEPTWPAIKLRAMACYESQIARADTRPWFIDDTLREWYADTDAT